MRLTLKDVKVNENYVLIISSNAGLWGYNVGDTIKFVSLEPYKVVVTGRINHFISAFGEHVIGEEVEAALSLSANEMGIKVTEFTVAPFISSGDQKSFHEWFIEFEKIPFDLDQFASLINTHLQQMPNCLFQPYSITKHYGLYQYDCE
jgi:hypothetical protein